jgi:hypothetical protein
MVIIWVMCPYWKKGGYQPLGRMWYLKIQGRNGSEYFYHDDGGSRFVHDILNHLKTIRYHNTEEHGLNFYYPKNFKTPVCVHKCELADKML